MLSQSGGPGTPHNSATTQQHCEATLAMGNYMIIILAISHRCKYLKSIQINPKSQGKDMETMLLSSSGTFMYNHDLHTIAKLIGYLLHCPSLLWQAIICNPWIE